jgi:hypothetical protein
MTATPPRVEGGDVRVLNELLKLLTRSVLEPQYRVILDYHSDGPPASPKAGTHSRGRGVVLVDQFRSRRGSGPGAPHVLDGRRLVLLRPSGFLEQERVGRGWPDANVEEWTAGHDGPGYSRPLQPDEVLAHWTVVDIAAGVTRLLNKARADYLGKAAYLQKAIAHAEQLVAQIDGGHNPGSNA